MICKMRSDGSGFNMNIYYYIVIRCESGFNIRILYCQCIEYMNADPSSSKM